MIYAADWLFIKSPGVASNCIWSSDAAGRDVSSLVAANANCLLILSTKGKGVFKIEKSKLGSRDLDEFEFELIDFGLDEVAFDEEMVYVYTDFTDFGTMQKALEDIGIEYNTAELQYVPNTYVDLTEDQAKEVLDLVDRLEGDDDVQNVYHNLR
jgi:transcriptional/translational regulatory protein YebC/TACO1